MSQEHLETYYALLKSNDLEVQQISSLSLLSFLLEGNGEWITKNSLSEKAEYNTCLKCEFFSTLPLKIDKYIELPCGISWREEKTSVKQNIFLIMD